MSSLQGGCVCGAIRYELSADPMMAIACHCRDCQYSSGGGPANVIAMAKTAVSITNGEPRAYRSQSDQGNLVTRHFCAECGTPLFAESAARPDFIGVKIGSLDDPGRFRPAANIWVKSAQPWTYLDPALPRFDKNPG